MRMRKKPNLLPRLARCEEYLIQRPEEQRGHWRRLMPGCRELRLELGCGKGRFTAETAALEPDVLFIAVERVPDAMVIAVERVRDMGLHNVYFVDGDAARLEEYFAPGEVDRIYINFCDPWPSNRHAKRRLTHPDFLFRYRKVLGQGRSIHFKTDNRDLFEWSLFQFPKAGYTLSEVTRDLHGQGIQGVMTDYEEKFHRMGTPINRCVATVGELPRNTLEERLASRLSGRALRPVEEGDCEAVLVLQRGNQDFFDRIQSGPLGSSEVAEAIRALPPGVAAEQKRYLGVWRDGSLEAVLDYVKGYPEPDILWIGFFMVARERQRCGEGRRIIRALLKSAGEAGLRAARLGCNVENKDGHRFWSALGFRDKEQQWELSHPEQRLIVMEGRLAGSEERK